MNKKIAIIGGGIFGTTIYIAKKKGIDCSLFEKKYLYYQGHLLTTSIEFILDIIILEII